MRPRPDSSCATDRGGRGGPPAAEVSEAPPTLRAMSEFTSETSQAAQEEGTIGAKADTENPALEKDPSDWVSGDDPMTPSQKSYLDTLAKQAGEELPADLNKAQASEHIDRLKSAQADQS